MDLNLQGKRVLITGSTRGIGLAAAQAFLDEGAVVAINGVNPYRMKQALAELNHQTGQLIGIAGNISEKSEIGRIFSEVKEKLGGLDVLVNNAAIHRRIPFMDIDENIFETMMNTNLKSLILCSQKAAEMMKRQTEGGVILNASSFASVVPDVGVGLYAATKAAIMNLTRTMAAELAPYNIRVNAYIPGSIATDMIKDAIEKNEGGLKSLVSLNRLGKPEEVAAPLAFLASSKASYITGVALEISGGKLAVQNPQSAWR